MAKRRRVLSYSSDEFIASDDSADYQPAPRGSRQRQVRKKKQKSSLSVQARRKSIKDDFDDASDENLDSLDSAVRYRVPPHGVSTHIISDAGSMRRALLDWYAKVHEIRGMPWRKPYDPSLGPEERSQRAYEVWISEIMLQQTQVSTVIPYYNAWMARFPTIRDLAASDIDTVNALWKGLGYYSRAARLLNGAKKVVDELGGRLPDNAKDMESKIPGVGRYSAGAICSIAYNQCVPVLDGNVHRLLSRVLALHAPPKAKQSLDVLWAGALSMVEGSDRPGDLNQALIELGSTVCKVREPACETCPLRPWCGAHICQNADNKDRIAVDTDGVSDIEELCSLCELVPHPVKVTSFPMKVERKKAREELDIVNVIEWRPNQQSEDRYFLLVRRPEGGLLAGLHEFPTKSDVPFTINPTTMSAIPRELLSRLLVNSIRSGHEARGKAGAEPQITPAIEQINDEDREIKIVKIRPVGEVLHVFSHIRKTYRVQWVVLEGGNASPPPLANCNLVPDSEAPPKNGPTGGRTGKRALSRGKGKPVPREPSTVLSQGMWVLMDDVPKANIGTGVSKVWKLACTLWNDTGR